MKIRLVRNAHKTNLQIDPITEPRQDSFKSFISICCSNNASKHSSVPYVNTTVFPSMDEITIKRFSIGLSLAADIMSSITNEKDLVHIYKQLQSSMSSHASLLDFSSSHKSTTLH